MQPLNLVIFKETKAYVFSNGILCKTVGAHAKKKDNGHIDNEE
jgi:hypothetical protein